MNVISADLEAMCLVLDPPKQRKVLVGTIYRPPDGKATSVIDQLDDKLSSFGDLNITAEIIILGDFNIDYKETKSPEYKYLKEFERNHQLKQYIKNPTRITNRVKSTIDLFF